MRIAFNRERKHYDPVYFFSPLGRARKERKKERHTGGKGRKMKILKRD